MQRLLDLRGQRDRSFVHRVVAGARDLGDLRVDEFEQGAVAVALSIMPHVGLLPRALPAFRKRYPKVRLQIVEGLFPDVEGGLREGAIDFHVGAAPRVAPAPGLELTHLFDNTRVVVCRQGHPLAGARSLSALARSEWAVTAVDYDAADDLSTLFASHGLADPCRRRPSSPSASPDCR